MTQILDKRTSETVRYDIDCSALLGSGEAITGAPVLSTDQVTTPPLTFGAPVVNASPITYADGHVAAAGQVIQVVIGGGEIDASSVSTLYTVRAKFSTNISALVEATVVLRVIDRP